MPLEGLDRELIEQFDGFYFAMRDPAGETIACRVTSEALQDVEPKYNPSSQDCIDAFYKHRARIEQLASDAFDRGERPPTITSSMLNG